MHRDHRRKTGQKTLLRLLFVEASDGVREQETTFHPETGNEYFIYDENNKTLLGEKTKTMYHIGDKIRIRVIRADKNSRQIDFEKVLSEEETEGNIVEEKE